MKKNIAILMLAVVAVFAVSSCKKYEEGPGFSLRSKAGRLDNTWELDMVKLNGKDVTTSYKAIVPDLLMVIKKDGTYEITAGGDRETGTWTFDSKKEKITTTDNASKTVEVWAILRLASDEFWYTVEDGSDKEEWHFKEK